MIDQFTPGMPIAPPPTQSSLRDQSTVAQPDGQDNKSFENYVSEAGQQNSNPGKNGAEQDDADQEQGANTTTADPRQLNDAVRRGMVEANESRIRLALLKQSQKGAGAGDFEKMMETARLLGKLQTAEKQKHAASDDGKIHKAETVAASPAEELSLLLGLTPAKTDAAKAVRKRDHDGDDEKSGKDGDKTALVHDKKSDAQIVHLDAVHPGKNNDDSRPKAASDADAVRVVSADGKGRPVDVPTTKSGSDGVGETDKRSSNAKFETATVIEARRYLGFSPDGNAGVLTNAITSDKTLTQAISHINNVEMSLDGNTVTEVNTLKLEMNPNDLGSMVASLKLKGDELSVEVRVDTVEAYRQLSADQDGIVKALQDQGFNIDQVSVQLNPTDKTDSGSDQDNLARQERNLRDGQGDQPNGRDGDARRSGNQDRWPRNDDRANSTSADGRTDPSRPGNIYL